MNDLAIAQAWASLLAEDRVMTLVEDPSVGDSLAAVVGSVGAVIEDRSTAVARMESALDWTVDMQLTVDRLLKERDAAITERDRLAAENAVLRDAVERLAAPIKEEDLPDLEQRTRLMLLAYALLPHALDCDACEGGCGCDGFDALRTEARAILEAMEGGDDV